MQTSQCQSAIDKEVTLAATTLCEKGFFLEEIKLQQFNPSLVTRKNLTEPNHDRAGMESRKRKAAPPDENLPLQGLPVAKWSAYRITDNRIMVNEVELDQYSWEPNTELPSNLNAYIMTDRTNLHEVYQKLKGVEEPERCAIILGGNPDVNKNQN